MIFLAIFFRITHEGVDGFREAGWGMFPYMGYIGICAAMVVVIALSHFGYK